MEFYENKQEPEKAVLIAVDTGEYDCDISLDELEELAETAGAEVVGRMSQKRDKPDSGTFLGSGRLEELGDFCKNNEVDLVIADSELAPAQLRNIEKATDVRVIDRTTLILDIFAERARSNEGKLQVELAQLRYSLPRLMGQGTKLSRLGGGIGTRGPGETKLESDRRHIRRRIKALEDEFDALEKRRSLARARREKDGVETVVIVGYTNAGKSTLMNTLTEAGVLAQDKLFATLDPTSRALVLPDGRRVMLIDTVGFIRRLPHHLVEAFKSTLEECAEHLKVTNDLLEELGCSGKPIIPVFNKCDLPQADEAAMRLPGAVNISALEGKGLDELLDAVAKALPPTRAKAKLLIPYSDGAAAAALRKDGVITVEDYRADGLYLELTADVSLIDRYQDYCV